MVLWEITLGTAYFLGLRRTYRLALRIQRRLIRPNHPKIRQFLHRRTRSVFDMVLRIHRNIQQRDIEVGRNLGNWILRRLDHMKPSAEIRPPPANLPTRSSSSNMPKHVTSSAQPLGTQIPNAKITDRESKGRLLFTSLNGRPKSFPTIAMMMRPLKSAGLNGQYRNVSYYAPYSSGLNSRRGQFEGVLRQDIAQWMLMN